ncbi:MAG: alpha/beta hydrolase [Chloroflexi bacterium]|nr:alpha/beta hydrolase [Chloroflexota bacterium]MBJ7360090.1 alpha/beta hydrolase [Chloroflexota bacterium]
MKRLRKIGIALLVVLVGLTTLPYLVDIPKGADADPATLLATAAAPGARTITADGVQSVIAEAGDPQDPALLLIHGFGGSTFGYRDVMEPLAARGWHVIAIDLPGFGLSEKSWGRDYSHKAQATFALAVLDQLKVDRAVLLGHSMGGNVISWMLALAPERIAGLAYIDAAVVQPKSGVSSSPSAAALLLDVPPIRRLTRIVIRNAFSPATFGELLSSAFAVKSAVTPTLVAGYAASSLLRDWDLALLGIIRDGAKNALPETIATLSAAAGAPPTLILWGRDDSWVPLTSGEVLRADLPEAEWVVLPGIGHVPFEEDAPAFIAAVGGWLDTLR